MEREFIEEKPEKESEEKEFEIKYILDPCENDVIEKILRKVKDENVQLIVIALEGPHGVGKTTFLSKMPCRSDFKDIQEIIDCSFNREMRKKGLPSCFYIKEDFLYQIKEMKEKEEKAGSFTHIKRKRQGFINNFKWMSNWFQKVLSCAEEYFLRPREKMVIFTDRSPLTSIIYTEHGDQLKGAVSLGLNELMKTTCIKFFMMIMERGPADVTHSSNLRRLETEKIRKELREDDYDFQVQVQEKYDLCVYHFNKFFELDGMKNRPIYTLSSPEVIPDHGIFPSFHLNFFEILSNNLPTDKERKKMRFST